VSAASGRLRTAGTLFFDYWPTRVRHSRGWLQGRQYLPNADPLLFNAAATCCDEKAKALVSTRPLNRLLHGLQELEMSTHALTTIGFDADDTLWQNEQYYRLTEEHFRELLADFAEGPKISERLLEAEKRNLSHYGFGIKGFTLSMIETAIEITEGKVPTSVIAQILDTGRDLLSHPVETMPHVRETLEALSGNYLLVLITKGDLFDQERKLAQSGLGDFFDAVEIVSEKTAVTYRRVFSKVGDGPERAMMVGNSLKSDIVPAIAAGSYGVFVPHELTWVLEHVDEPKDAPRFRKIAHLGELGSLLGGLS
jgi:putative hydrolase of the HAD superfamily